MSDNETGLSRAIGVTEEPRPAKHSSLQQRLSNGALDNVVNLASNFPVPFLIAAVGDDAGRELGAVAIALLVVNLTTGLGSAAGVEVVAILDKKGVDSANSLRSEAISVAVAVSLLGLVGGLVAFWSLSVLTLANGLLLLALPIFVLQRQLRLLGHVVDEIPRVTQSSVVWLVVSAAVLAIFWLSTSLSPSIVIIAWVAGAIISLGDLLFRWDVSRNLRLRKPSPEVRATSASLGFEFVVDRGAIDTLGLLLAASFGVVFAGQLRIAQTLFGVSNLLVGSARTVLLVETRQRYERQSSSLARFSLLLSLGLAAIPLATAVLALLAAEPLLGSLIGPTIVGAIALVPWVGAHRVFRNLAIGPSFVLRVAGHLRTSRRLRVVTGLMVVAVGGFSLTLENADVALQLLALTSVIAAAIWYRAGAKAIASGY